MAPTHPARLRTLRKVQLAAQKPLWHGKMRAHRPCERPIQIHRPASTHARCRGRQASPEMGSRFLGIAHGKRHLPPLHLTRSARRLRTGSAEHEPTDHSGCTKRTNYGNQRATLRSTLARSSCSTRIQQQRRAYRPAHARCETLECS